MESAFEWKAIKGKKITGHELFEKDKSIATLVLAEKKSSFKASLFTENESYKIRRRGFWKTVIVITNKDEEVVARSGYEKLHYGKGALEIKPKKYFYKFFNSPLAELLIFEKEIHPFLSYKLTVKNKTIGVDLTTSPGLNKNKNYILFLAMGWYMFQPIVKENIITKWL